jgi:hypothetical protein
MTDAHQRELSDRWLEGMQIREWVKDIWTDCEAADAALS